MTDIERYLLMYLTPGFLLCGVIIGQWIGGEHPNRQGITVARLGLIVLAVLIFGPFAMAALLFAACRRSSI